MVSAESMIVTANLQKYERAIADGMAALARDRIISRIWRKDWTVWHDDPTEIKNRLGWLTSPRSMEKELSGIRTFVRDIRKRDFTHALLLGMGGS
ncbi:MAG: glucose-6-phosphate isomerase, partial [Candidatus Aminicenantes bacterium]|nr:glucose-6-phosphate isomerase [Candidatus Aminicenantes bacterium]